MLSEDILRQSGILGENHGTILDAYNNLTFNDKLQFHPDT
jgi:hypothetical protein